MRTSLERLRAAALSFFVVGGAGALACTPTPPSVDAGESDAGSGTNVPDGGAPLDDGGAPLDAGGDAGLDGGHDAGPEDGGAPLDAGDDAGLDSGPDVDGGSDGGELEACAAPEGRGLSFVRENPMVITGLSVVMGAPTAAQVNAYFDEFHANAVHVWETGLPAEISAWSAAGRADFRYLSWVHRDGTSLANGEVLGGLLPALPGRIGYQIGDEPTDQAALDAIAAGALVVADADPEGLRIVNLNDTDGAYALREQAANLATVDVLSYDHYNWGRDAYEGLNDTRRVALAAGKPYWRYVKSFFYKDESPEGTLSDLRWDAFVGAVYGFTGYTWFVYSIEAGSETLAPLLFETGGDFDAPRTPLYEAAATVNQELARLGRALVMLTNTDVRYVAAYSLLKPPGISAWTPGAGGDPYLSDVEVTQSRDLLVGFFVDDCGERYVMLQAQAHDGADFPNASTAATDVTLTFEFGGAPATLDDTHVEMLDLTSGDVGELALTSAGGTSATLSVSLPAGAPLLFKYATERPFALQPAP